MTKKIKFEAIGSDSKQYFRTSSRNYVYAVVGSWCGQCGKNTRCCNGNAYFSMTLKAAEAQLRQLQSSRFDASWANRKFEIVEVKAVA